MAETIRQRKLDRFIFYENAVDLASGELFITTRKGKRGPVERRVVRNNTTCRLWEYRAPLAADK